MPSARACFLVFAVEEPQPEVPAPSPVGTGVALLAALVLFAAIIGLAVLLQRSRRFWALLAWLGRGSIRESLLGGRRELLLNEPLPPAWEEILNKHFGLYPHLPPDDRKKLHGLVHVLVAEKEWTGCNGLPITDEVRVTIAAAAAVLLLGREHDYYSTVQSILVYPTTFEMPAERVAPSGVVLGGEELLGQAWYRGPVLLAWDEVLLDCRHPFEGRNVVYHEFAHQVAFEGVSLAAGTDNEERWKRFGSVMRQEYEALVRASQHGRATLIDSYGATNPDEFFAVATECFFGQPEQMRRRHSQLYEVLLDFYRQDPIRFHRHPV
jgi:Mlc titration factor MtfA (ptsG expression regulator)